MSQMPVLGVERSASGKLWMMRTQNEGPQPAGEVERQGLAISQRLQLPEVLGRLLAARGQTLDTAESFLNPRLRDLLPDPSILKDMDKAVTRIVAALQAGQQIAIFGDYDVDGATSAALLMRFLKVIGAKPIRLYVPDRLAEGYGPNGPAMHKLKAEGVDLVITVDCGITAFAPLQAAADIALDVVVVEQARDHVAGRRAEDVGEDQDAVAGVDLVHHLSRAQDQIVGIVLAPNAERGDLARALTEDLRGALEQRSADLAVGDDQHADHESLDSRASRNIPATSKPLWS